MGSSDEAQAAIDSLDGQEFEGRNLRVNIAKEKTDRPSRGPRTGGRGGNFKSYNK